MKFESKNDLLKYSKKIISTKVKEYDFENELNKSRNKGIIGQIVEKHFFNKKLDSNRDADFHLENGEKVELKVTPIKIVKKHEYRAKERLSLSVINYEKDYKDEFELSKLYEKMNSMLIIYYLFEPNKKIGDYKFINTSYLILDENSNDFQIIKNDYNIIMQKIKDGKAHELSEADTLYLSAATKGASSSSLRKQPFNTTLARQRAFALKNSYMSTYFQNLTNNTFGNELVIPNEFVDPRTTVINSLQKYKSVKLMHLYDNFNISRTTAKHKDSMLLKKIFIHENLVDFINKSKINIKTIKLSKYKNGTYNIKESLKVTSIPNNEFTSEWEESSIYEYIDSSIFLFVYTYDDYIYDFKIFNFSFEEKNEIKKVWENCKKSYLYGTITYPLPKTKDSPIAHIRPGAINKNDTYLIPSGENITKQAFWINAKYMLQIFNNSSDI